MNRQFIITYKCGGGVWHDAYDINEDITPRLVKDCFDMAMCNEVYDIISMRIFYEV